MKHLCIFAALLFSACASNTVVTVPVCGPIKTVCISKDDALTEKTASQIEGNNLALSKMCKVKASCNRQNVNLKPI